MELTLPERVLKKECDGRPLIKKDRPAPFLRDKPGEVTVQPGLRISCADRTKTYRQEASGPSRSDWNGRVPLLFCRRLNSNPESSGAASWRDFRLLLRGN